MNKRWTLDGRRAVVTGATKGIGRAVADELIALGASVLLVARDAAEVEQQTMRAKQEYGAAGRVFGVAADVTQEHGRRTLLEEARRTLGGLDILVNNVGTNIRKPSLEYAADEYESLFQTNLSSAWEMCRAAHPLLAAGDNASIVNIGSVAGSLSVHSGAPYAMTKAALDQLTRYLAVEWAGDSIRVNCVAPWYTDTPLANAVLSNPDFAAGVLARTPLGRIAEPEDISGAVAFLCLPCARHITGQVLAVDGGFTAFGF